MYLPIRKQHVIIFLFIFVVVSLISFKLLDFNGQYFSEDRMVNDELKVGHNLLRDGEPAYSIEQAKSIAIELIPIIERTAGKKFKQRPKITLISTKKFESFLINDFLNNHFLNNQKSSIDDVKHEAIILSKTLTGYYDKVRQTIYLLPQNIPVVIHWLKLDKKYSLDISKIVIAHELTHALQDQYMNFVDCFNKIPGSDELYAFRSTIEGHAVFIEKEIGKQLGIDDLIINLSTSTDSVKAILNNPLDNFRTVYADGYHFIDYAFKKGGNKLLWKILKSPPIDSSMIIYPETYCEKNYDTVNYRTILANIYDFNTINKDYEFYYQNYSINKLGFREMLRNFNLSEMKLFLLDVNHVQTFVVRNKNRDNIVAEISFVLLKDQQNVAKVVDTLEKIFTIVMKRINPTDIETWIDVPVNKILKELIKSIRQTSATNIFKTSNDKTKHLTTKNHILINGNMLVAIYDGGLNLPLFDIEMIAATIFDRYQDAKRIEFKPNLILNEKGI